MGDPKKSKIQLYGETLSKKKQSSDYRTDINTLMKLSKSGVTGKDTEGSASSYTPSWADLKVLDYNNTTNDQQPAIGMGDVKEAERTSDLEKTDPEEFKRRGKITRMLQSMGTVSDIMDTAKTGSLPEIVAKRRKDVEDQVKEGIKSQSKEAERLLALNNENQTTIKKLSDLKENLQNINKDNEGYFAPDFSGMNEYTREKERLDKLISSIREGDYSSPGFAENIGQSFLKNALPNSGYLLGFLPGWLTSNAVGYEPQNKMVEEGYSTAKKYLKDDEHANNVLDFSVPIRQKRAVENMASGLSGILGLMPSFRSAGKIMEFIPQLESVSLEGLEGLTKTRTAIMNVLKSVPRGALQFGTQSVITGKPSGESTVTGASFEAANEITGIVSALLPRKYQSIKYIAPLIRAALSGTSFALGSKIGGELLGEKDINILEEFGKGVGMSLGGHVIDTIRDKISDVKNNSFRKSSETILNKVFNQEGIDKTFDYYTDIYNKESTTEQEKNLIYNILNKNFPSKLKKSGIELPAETTAPQEIKREEPGNEPNIDNESNDKAAEIKEEKNKLKTEEEQKPIDEPGKEDKQQEKPGDKQEENAPNKDETLKSKKEKIDKYLQDQAKKKQKSEVPIEDKKAALSSDNVEVKNLSDEQVHKQYDKNRTIVEKYTDKPNEMLDKLGYEVKYMDDDYITEKAEQVKELYSPVKTDDEVTDKDDIKTSPTAKEDSGISKNKPVITADEIPYDTAYRAWRNSSHTPEDRAKQEQDNYAETMQSDLDELEPIAEKSGRVEEFYKDFEKYKEGYKNKFITKLNADSRTASSMITGPANFNVRSNKKKLDSANKRLAELVEFRKGVLKRLKQEYRPEEEKPIVKGESNTAEKLQNKLDGLISSHGRMKEINKVFKEKGTDGLKDLKLSPEETKAIANNFKYSDSKKPFPDYTIKNSSAAINKLNKDIETESKRTEKYKEGNIEYKSKDIRVLQNAEDNRVQVFFDGKPDESTIAKLKSKGFRWAPSSGAWQRQLTDVAVNVTKQLFPPDETKPLNQIKDVGAIDRIVTDPGEIGKFHADLEKRISSLGIKGVTVELESIPVAKSGIKAGYYDAANKRLVLNDKILFGDTPDHEWFHLATDLLGERETWDKMLTEAGWDGKERDTGNKTFVDAQEKLADEYTDYVKGQTSNTGNTTIPKNKTIWDKVREFFRQMLNFFKSKGIDSKYEVFKDLFHGKIRPRFDLTPEPWLPYQVRDRLQKGALLNQDKNTAEPFYSKLEKTAETKVQNNANPEQLIKTLLNNGVKQEEIDWMGLEEELESGRLNVEGKNGVDKTKLTEFIKNNKLKIDEKVLDNTADVTVIDGLTGEPLEVFTDRAAAEEYIKENQSVDLPLQLDDATNKKSTKFSQYQLPGGDNYREMLFTVPQMGDNEEFEPVVISKIIPDVYGYNVTFSDGKKSSVGRGVIGKNATDSEIKNYFKDSLKYKNDKAKRLFDAESSKDNFKSTHFDAPNIVAHARVNDREVKSETAEGKSENKKMMFVEEVQSDWHQKGRKRGYRKGSPEQQNYATWATEKGMSLEEINDTWKTEDKRYKEWEEYLQKAYANALAVPDAPFKKTWHEFVLKNLLRKAVENGYDKIGWTTGEQQNERYDLSKQIDEVSYSKSGDKYNILYVPKGQGTYTNAGEFTSDKLPDVIGKELADKIIKGEGEDTPSGMKKFSGLDLKIEGTGMKGFYDKIIPDFLNKYVKKWGGKVESEGISVNKPTPLKEPSQNITVENTHVVKEGNTYKLKNDDGITLAEGSISWRDNFYTDKDHHADLVDMAKKHPIDFNAKEIIQIHSLDITPEMRKSVLFEGQPLFDEKGMEAIGKYHYNNGAVKFEDWKKKMQEHTSEALDETELKNLFDSISKKVKNLKVRKKDGKRSELERQAIELKKTGATNQEIRDKLGFDFVYHRHPLHTEDFHSASLLGKVVKKPFEEIPIESIEPGDMVIHNLQDQSEIMKVIDIKDYPSIVKVQMEDGSRKNVAVKGMEIIKKSASSEKSGLSAELKTPPTPLSDKRGSEEKLSLRDKWKDKEGKTPADRFKEKMADQELGIVPPKEQIEVIIDEQGEVTGIRKKELKYALVAIEHPLMKKVGDKLKGLTQGIITAIDATLPVTSRQGAELTGKILKAIHTAEGELIRFDNKRSQVFDQDFEEVQKMFDKFSKKDLNYLNLTRGTPVTELGQAAKEEAETKLKPGLKDSKIMQVIKEASDYNFKYARDNKVKIDYFEDYFYGAYDNKKEAVDNFLKYWKSSDRYVNEKAWPTPADALAAGLKLKDPNPITNLKRELQAISTRVAYNGLKDEWISGKQSFAVKGTKGTISKQSIPLKGDIYRDVETNAEYRIVDESKRSWFVEPVTFNPTDPVPGTGQAPTSHTQSIELPKVHFDSRYKFVDGLPMASDTQLQEWRPIQDPVFEGLIFSPEIAKLFNNLISTNKVSQNKFLAGARVTSQTMQQIKFLGSMFHFFNMVKGSLVQAGTMSPKGLIDFIKSFKKYDAKDPDYADFVQHGGGHSYSIESQSQKKLLNLTELPSKIPYLGTHFIKYVPYIGSKEVSYQKFFPASPAFINWMFEDYIPTLKFMKYKQEKVSKEKNFNRELRSDEKIEIIKQNQNFYGEQNERLYGRSGTVTSAMRLIFTAPGFAEGNYRTMVKAATSLFTTWSKKGKSSDYNSLKFLLGSLTFTIAAATLGTRIMSGKWPDAPKEPRDIRDLFKIRTGQKDNRGNEVLIDMMTYEKDYWAIPGNIIKLADLKPMEVGTKIIEEQTLRAQNMFSTPFRVTADLMTISQGGMIYDYRGKPIYYQTDTFAQKLVKFMEKEAVTSEPIPVGGISQTMDKGTDWIMATAQAILGVRTTTTERVKDEKKIINDLHTLEKSRIDKLSEIRNLPFDEQKKRADEYNTDAQKKISEFIGKTQISSDTKDEINDRILIDIYGLELKSLKFKKEQSKDGTSVEGEFEAPEGKPKKDKNYYNELMQSIQSEIENNIYDPEKNQKFKELLKEMSGKQDIPEESRKKAKDFLKDFDSQVLLLHDKDKIEDALKEAGVTKKDGKAYQYELSKDEKEDFAVDYDRVLELLDNRIDVVDENEKLTKAEKNKQYESIKNAQEKIKELRRNAKNKPPQQRKRAE